MTGPISYTAMNENGVMLPTEKNGKIPSCHTSQLEGEEEDNSKMCGWGSFQPKVCQRFLSAKWVLFWLSMAGAVQGMVVNGFVNVVISNIERRYDLSSTESGTIASCYDIASVLCLIPISYFGGLGRKPRYLGIGILVLGIGSFVFALPHFLSGKYNYITTHNVCTGNPVNGSSLLTCSSETNSNTLSQYKYMFFFGQLLHGAGASPLYTLGVTYLDENLSVRTSPVYIGIFYTMAIIGPAFGYLLGGKFLDLYVDINTVDTSTIGMKSGDAKFVGAWWIGFLMSGMIAFTVSLPMCGFPRELAGAKKYKLEREAEVYHQENSEEETHGSLSSDNGFKLGWKAILSSLKILTSNPTFMFLNLAAACEGILLSGFATFAPKFIESQFSLSASVSAVYVGYIVVPAGGGGTFLGGVLVRMLKLKVRGIIRMCLILSLILLPLLLIFLLRCQENRFVGISVPYITSNKSSTTTPFLVGSLNAECNINCHCNKENFDPVCGLDGSVYFSPCYAGCKTHLPSKHRAPNRYHNCSCINVANSSSMDFIAESGKCPTKCNMLKLFMPFFSIVMLITFIISMPALTATLRCVPQKQRSFGLGIQWIVARCLGSIPGPIMFGKMIDLTCRLWQHSCSDHGYCYFYDNERMGVYLMALTFVVKALSSFFFFLALVMYKAAPNTNCINMGSDSTSSALSTFSHRANKQDNNIQNSLEEEEEEDENEQCERTLMEDNSPPQTLTP